MKFETTDTHPELKEGLTMRYTSYDDRWSVEPSNLYSCTDIQKDGLLEDGYIKEVQEKEFTKDDMMDFGCAFLGQVLPVSEYFEHWLTQKK